MGHISTLHYFRPSPQFVALYLPHAIEVGRSFVSPLPDRHPLFAMEALWQGLGRVVSAHASVRYMFGKVTLYRDYDDEARRLLMLFLRKFFPPQSPLLQARTPFVEREGDDPFTMEFFDDNYTLLRRLLHRAACCGQVLQTCSRKPCPREDDRLSRPCRRKCRGQAPPAGGCLLQSR